MAAIAGVLSAVLPIALPLLKPLLEKAAVHLQNIFGSDKAAGPIKLEQLAAIAKSLTDGLAGNGKLPAGLDMAAITTICQTIVEGLKASGALPSSRYPAEATPVVTPTQGATVVNASINGTVVRIIGTMEVLK